MYNGNKKIRSTRGGLTVAEIFEQLEEFDDNIQNINIFAIPPLDGNDTDHDSDASDDEHEANLNHLGPKLLNAECEVQRIDSEDDWSEGDEEPLGSKIH